MIRLAVNGCQGRMGQRITKLALEDSDFQVAALLERPDHPMVGQTLERILVSSDPQSIKGCDVMIDFTSPLSTSATLKACRQFRVNCVIGTTGLTPEQVAEVQEASAHIAVVYSANMSAGVNILFKLAEYLAGAAPADYQVRMVEAHHVHKKDAPSGTAKTLSHIIESSSAHKVGGIQAVREGEIVGDHKIIFESPDDVITIEHHAKTRDIFVKGALAAARFLRDKKSGFFDMKDVLAIR